MQYSTRFPDLSTCRTRHMYEDCWKCLANGARFCPFSYSLGCEYLCKHPENYDFSIEC